MEFVVNNEVDLSTTAPPGPVVEGEVRRMSDIVVPGDLYIETGIVAFDSRGFSNDFYVDFKIPVPQSLNVTVKSQIAISLAPAGYAYYTSPIEHPNQEEVYINSTFEIKSWIIWTMGQSGTFGERVAVRIHARRPDGNRDANFYSASYHLTIKVK